MKIIEERLRQLHKIEPDPGYAREARARLLLAIQPRFRKVTFQVFIRDVLRSGSAMAVTGLLLLFALGGFSIWSMMGQITGWDSNTLMAEAQAIDIQIHLAELQYKDGGYGRQRLISSEPDFSSAGLTVEPETEGSSDEEVPLENATSTPADPTAPDENGSSTPADPTGSETPTEPEQAPDPVSVEDALDILSR